MGKPASCHHDTANERVPGTVFQAPYLYQVKKDKRSGNISDPNCSEDPEYIVRLVGQVTAVSLETVCIVISLPDNFGE